MAQSVELLAPAGDFDALKAAVQNGADAVYFGGQNFSARQFASNFHREQIVSAVRYCHVRNVKTYVTVNTLILNDEFEKVLDHIFFLYNSGVDAIILQDMGLMRAVAKLLPQLELHASTQMTVHNSAGLEFVKECGVKRAVLAREVSLEDIKNIKSKTDMGLEIFVHGALCVSYSGQCLMSSMVGGRSGNRGRCAQPCRLPYTWVRRTTGEPLYDSMPSYLLSTKDLNLLSCLPEVVESGVSAFKIEGRMKQAEYVAVVVKTYRSVLDRYFSDPESFYVSERELQDLAQIFNRGFTKGYMFGDTGRELMSYSRPNNRGVYLGRVSNVDHRKGCVEISLENDLRKGDGIVFWVTESGRTGKTVKNLYDKRGMEVEEIKGGGACSIGFKDAKGIRRGDRVFKTYDSNLIAQARQTFMSPMERCQIPLVIQVKVAEGKPMSLEAVDSDANRVLVKTDFVAEKAIKRPLSTEIIRKQLERLGNTPFSLKELNCSIERRPIVPVSEINKARRKLVEALEKVRCQNKVPPSKTVEDFEREKEEILSSTTPIGVQNRRKTPSLSVSVGNLESVRQALIAGAERIYFNIEGFGGKRRSVQDVKGAIALCNSANVELFCVLPRILQEQEMEEFENYLECIWEAGPSGFSAGNPGLVHTLKEYGIENIHADFPLNIFNDQSIRFFREKGVSSFTLSPELNIADLRSLNVELLEGECLVHGSFPLMVSEHSMFFESDRFSVKRGEYGLKDRMNFVFPAEFDSQLRTYLFNPKDLCMIKKIEDLWTLGVGYFRIEAAKEDSRYVRETVCAYKKIMYMHKNGLPTAAAAARAEEILVELNPQGFTKGHYFRGID